ncbi:hypothetical protein DPMN_110050 [Dreissena polymorpha]|uniref:Uncharacterized protein n=1 Tax=Dreissena polymorpha TaxID=45954 RepID=A0A9D4KBX3_DREPO|nr:hypothetical protein DPMN_110050 [Dreissena polymorpha]
MEQKGLLLAAYTEYTSRKHDNVMGSHIESKTAIGKEFYSTSQIDVNSISTREGADTSNSDQTLDDLNSVYVKMETDELYSTAAGFYSMFAKSQQVLGEEIHQDCNIKDGLNLVHEQLEKIGFLKMVQDQTKQDGFTSACVKSKQMGCEIMHQDVTRQPGYNSVCMNRKQSPDSNAYRAHNGLHPVGVKTTKMDHDNNLHVSRDPSCEKGEMVISFFNIRVYFKNGRGHYGVTHGMCAIGQRPGLAENSSIQIQVKRTWLLCCL